MKLELTKTLYESGDYSIETDRDHVPFSKVKREWKQIVDVDEAKWIEVKSKP